jgi:multiple sugar transport system permease protein
MKGCRHDRPSLRAERNATRTGHRGDGPTARAVTMDENEPRSLLARFFSRPDLLTPSPATRLAMHLVLGFWAFVCLFPLYWLFITSFKLPIHVSAGPFYLPFVDFEPSGHAWRYIFVDLGRDTFRPYLNSVIVASIATVLSLVIGALAAYALTRFAYRITGLSVLVFAVLIALVIAASAAYGVDIAVGGAVALALFLLYLFGIDRKIDGGIGNDDVLSWIISNRILPPVVVVLPVYILFQRLHLLDTHAALIITYSVVNLPIVVWLLRDFFASIPLELDESAAIDGASRFRVFWTIVLPLARPGLAATALLVFILCWNEYLLALFLSTAEAQTMPLLVAAQNATRGPQWWYMSVLIILMIVPVLLLALVLQRFIARGLLIGAVKG